jgi:hypothetical protein
MFSLECEQELGLEIDGIGRTINPNASTLQDDSPDQAVSHIEVRGLKPPWMKVLPDAAPQAIAVCRFADVRNVGLTTKPALWAREAHRVDTEARGELPKEILFALEGEWLPVREPSASKIT